VLDPDGRDPLTGSLNDSDRFALKQMLEEWEEPTVDRPEDQSIPISAVLNFRKAQVFIQKTYPFSRAFGEASTREQCIESAQDVYLRLLQRTPDSGIVHFETLALTTLDEKGSIDHEKARELVKLFRPDRQGNLTLVDFVKSVDSVYKSYRLLSASIANSSRIDRAFENIFNVVFYMVVATVVLAALGFDPVAIFLSLSSIILAFAFMIGRASANYFEGLMFILVRRPYSIGDRIHISNPETDTDMNGSRGWVVENVTLYETTAIWTPTKERCRYVYSMHVQLGGAVVRVHLHYLYCFASLSNGSLANSRIINAARSPQAQFFIYLKFPIDTPYEKILIFKSAVEEYLKARPRGS
jgi:hypothetical protein